MKRSKKDNSLLLEIITIALVVVVLALCIAGTFLLEGNMNQEWEYRTDDSDLDYYAQGSGNDFQYATSLKYAISNYFGTTLNQYVNIASLIEPFSEKVVTAMSKARIPARKLKLIADQLDADNLASPFKDFAEFIKQFDNVYEFEDYLLEMDPVGFFSTLFSGISSIFRQTNLTEDEFATFIYEYLSSNASDSYKSFLLLIGREYFIKLLSNTLYVIVRMDETANTQYMSASTSSALQQVCYQLGSTYVNIAKISGGTTTFERILWWTWDYDVSTDKGKMAQELSDSVRGKIGDLFLVLGNVLKNATTSDIEFIVNKNNGSDEHIEECNQIISSIKLAKALNQAVVESNDILTEKYSTTDAFFDKYQEVSVMLSELAYIVSEGEKDEEYEQSRVDLIDVYTQTKKQMSLLLTKNYLMEELLNMDVESDEYKELKEASSFINNVEGQVSYLLSQIFYVMVVNQLDSIPEENDA